MTKPMTERAMKIAETKARKEAEAEAAREADRVAALRRTEPVERDLPRPAYGEPDTSGWDFNAYDHGRVYRAWSSSHSHGDGPARDSRFSGSQNGIAMFSTKARALRALRYAIEKRAGEQLANVDRQIAECDE